MKMKLLLYLGSVIPLIFWGTLIGCGFVMGDYNHSTRMVSELGAIGTRTQCIFTAGLLTCAFLSVLFVIGLCQACRKMEINIMPALIILSFSMLIGGAAIFPLPLRMHLIMGMPSILLIISPLLSLFLWHGEKRLPRVRLMSLASLLIMALGFLAYFPGILSAYPGLKQRFFHLGWSIWFFYLSYVFLKLRRQGS